MRTTTAAIPFNPTGLGVEYPFQNKTVIKGLGGVVTIGGQDFDVSAASMDAALYKSKEGHTAVFLVYDPDEDEVRYHAETGSPDSPVDKDLTPLRALVQLAWITVPPGGELGDADGKIVDVEPMVETRAVPMYDDAGNPLKKRITEELPDGTSYTREEQMYEHQELPVTI